MATMFRQNITQNVEPAAADVSGLARAGEATANIFKTVAGITGEVSKGMLEGKLQNMEQGIEEIAKDFYISNMGATAAAEKASVLGMQREATAAGMEEQMGMWNPETPDWTAVEKQVTTALAPLDQELTRLTSAAQSGMSTKQMMTRVNDKMRQYIAQYPELADQIRERAKKVIGFEGDDRWAYKQFIDIKLAGDKAADDEYKKYEAASFKQLAGAGLYTEEQLFTAKRTNPALYQQMEKQSMDLLGLAAQSTALKNQRDMAQNLADTDANKLRGNFVASVETNVAQNVVQAMADQSQQFMSVMQGVADGTTTADPVKLKAAIDFNNAFMNTYITNAEVQARADLRKFFRENPNVSKAMRDEMNQDVTDTVANLRKIYQDDKGHGLSAMALVLTNYRDKTIADQSKLIELITSQISATGNADLVKAYYGSPETKERLKRENPSFYSLMEQGEKGATQATSNISSMLSTGAGINFVQQVVTTAKNNGGAAVQPNTAVDATTNKAAVEVLRSNAATLLKNVDAKKELTPFDVNLISSAIATGIETGVGGTSADPRYRPTMNFMGSDYSRLHQSIKKLPENGQAVIKDNASMSSVNTFARIQGYKRNIEAKYPGVKLTIGVNSAGMISAMPSVTQGTMTAMQPARAAVRPEMQNEMQAIKEFNNLTAAISSNLVFGRAIVTGEEPTAIGKEYATLINEDKPFTGFFSLQPQPVAGAGRGVVNPPEMEPNETGNWWEQ